MKKTEAIEEVKLVIIKERKNIFLHLLIPLNNTEFTCFRIGKSLQIGNSNNPKNKNKNKKKERETLQVFYFHFDCLH